jgi:molybdopterin-guanine dinucleotide biosynthesis protein A
VDLPNIDGRLVRALIDLTPGEPGVVVPTWPSGHMEPLCALYHRDVGEVLHRMLGDWTDPDRAAGACPGLQRAIDHLRGEGYTVIPLAIPMFLEQHGLEESYFTNVNEPLKG